MFNMFKNYKKRIYGFTLIELIVVIAIIGVLAAILVPSMMGYVKKAKRTNDVSSARNMYNKIIELNLDSETSEASFYNTTSAAYSSPESKLDEISHQNYSLCVVAYLDGSKSCKAPNAYVWTPVSNDYKDFCDQLNSRLEFKGTDIEVPIKYSNENGKTLNRWFVGYRVGTPSQVEIWVGDGSAGTNGNGETIKCLYTHITREQ